MKLPSVINHRTSVASSTAVILSSLYNVGHLQVSVPLRSALLVSTSQYQSIGSSHVAIFQHRYRSKSKARLANHNRMPIVVVHEQLTSSFLQFSYKYLKHCTSFPKQTLSFFQWNSPKTQLTKLKPTNQCNLQATSKTIYPNIQILNAQYLNNFLNSDVTVYKFKIFLCVTTTELT